MTVFAVTIERRMLSVTQQESEAGQRGRWLDLGRGVRRSFRAIQEGIELVLQKIAESKNLLTDRHEIDWVNFREALRTKRITIEVRGPARELRVLALHVRLAFDLGSDLIKTIPRADEVSGYEYFHVDFQIEPFQKLLSYIDGWYEINDKVLKLEWGKHHQTLRNSLVERDIGKPKICIGVLGEVKAGKSTFLNGLLRRPVLPTDAEICTAAVAEVLWAPSPSQERVEVQFRSDANLKQDMRQLAREIAYQNTKSAQAITSEAKNTHETLGQQAEAKRQSIEKARREIQCWRGHIELKRLAELGSIGKKTGVDDLIEVLRIYLHEPLLEHLSLVDTPGLNDSNETRCRLAINAVSKLDAWLYLADGVVTESKLDNMNDIFAQANKKKNEGVIILTKIDTLGSADKADFTRTVQRRRDNVLEELRKLFPNWNPEVLMCSAKPPEWAAGVAAPAAFARFTYDDWEEQLRFLCGEKYLTLAEKLFRTAPKVWLSRKLENEFVAAHGDSEAIQTFSDYILECSHLPECTRYILEEIITKEHDRRIERVREDLEASINGERDRLAGAQKRHREYISNIESAEKMLRNVADCEAKIATTSAEVASLRDRHSECVSFLSAKIDETEKEIQKQKAKRITKVKEDLHAKIEEQSDWELRGQRSFDLFAAFDKVFAQICSEKIDAFYSHFEQRMSRFPEFEKTIPLKPPSFSLHDPKPEEDTGRAQVESATLQDYEGLFERLSTVKERMWNQADSTIATSGATIVENAVRKMKKALKTMERAVNNKTSQLESKIQTIETEKSELQLLIDKLQTADSDGKGATDSDLDHAAEKQRLEQRLADLGEMLAQVIAFDTSFSNWYRDWKQSRAR